MLDDSETEDPGLTAARLAFSFSLPYPVSTLTCQTHPLRLLQGGTVSYGALPLVGACLDVELD